MTCADSMVHFHLFYFVGCSRQGYHAHLCLSLCGISWTLEAFQLGKITV